MSSLLIIEDDELLRDGLSAQLAQVGHSVTAAADGEAAQVLLDLGFVAVDKDFPVFLHPHTHEEYALARLERKTAPGYHGFAIHAAPEVTLEEDLARRDTAINYIAACADGTGATGQLQLPTADATITSLQLGVSFDIIGAP